MPNYFLYQDFVSDGNYFVKKSILPKKLLPSKIALLVGAGVTGRFDDKGKPVVGPFPTAESVINSIGQWSKSDAVYLRTGVRIFQADVLVSEANYKLINHDYLKHFPGELYGTPNNDVTPVRYPDNSLVIMPMRDGLVKIDHKWLLAMAVIYNERNK